MRPSLLLVMVLLSGCGREPQAPAPAAPRPAAEPAPARPARDHKLVHVFVALCDNRNQGIVKVPAHLGNGQDPAGNLYWGAAYGVKTFLARSGSWEELPLAGAPRRPEILARALFKSRGAGPAVRILAEAYDGAHMKEALTDFFGAAAGTLAAAEPADLVCFVGHNGLMDMKLSETPKPGAGPRPEAAVVLACKSQAYFAEPLRTAGCRPLVLTTGFMAPEAYTLEAIVTGWAAGDSPERIRERAAEAYARYQKCGRSAAAKLFAAE